MTSDPSGVIAPAAQAFTIQDSGGPNGGQGFIDFDKPAAAPDRMAPVSRFGNENGQTTIKQGNGTFQFGGQQSFGQRYNAPDLLRRLGEPGLDIAALVAEVT